MTTEEAYRAGYHDAMRDAKQVLADWDKHEPRIVGSRLAIHEIVLSAPDDADELRRRIEAEGFRVTFNEGRFGGLDAQVRKQNGGLVIGMHFYNGPDTNEADMLRMIFQALQVTPRHRS